MTRSRWRCSMPPCSASARWPCALKVSPSDSTSRRVRQNTSVAAGSSMSRIRARAAGLCGRWTMYATWRTRGTLPAAGFSRAIVMRAGSLRCRCGERENPCGHRRREEGRLPCGGRGLQDLVEIVGKAHVQHLVGLVQHQHLEAAEDQRAAPHVVEGAARRCHHDVGAALERADLLMHRRAAVQRQHRQSDALARTCAQPRQPASRARASGPGRGHRWRARPGAPR